MTDSLSRYWPVRRTGNIDNEREQINNALKALIDYVSDLAASQGGEVGDPSDPELLVTDSSLTGEGTAILPLAVSAGIVDAAENSFQIPLLFAEITTQVDRLEAQENLGLHIIDGGTF